MGAIISGLVWIAIFLAIGVYGAGIEGFVGKLISYPAMLFAALSIFHVVRIISYTLKGKRMMEENPEKFNELRKQYYEAMNSDKNRKE